jgi:hypothetical protein
VPGPSGKNQYFVILAILARANIWQKPVFGKSQYLAKASIWQKPVFGKTQCLAKANILDNFNFN